MKPQIFNVLKGEMMSDQDHIYRGTTKFLDKDGEIILSVYPGITGLWEVSSQQFILRTPLALTLVCKKLEFMD